MKPVFALSLSFEGIGLAVRARDGWRHVGEVKLDTPDLPGALDALRERGDSFSGAQATSKIVLPTDQVRYLTVETGSFEGETRRTMVLRALEQATPYGLDDLSYDIRDADGRSFVAAVARDTLNEAEAFAVEHGFAPMSFVAVPEPADFPGEPFFGKTAYAGTADVTPDMAAIRIVGDAGRESAPPIVAEAATAEPPATFVSRRGKNALIEAARPPAASARTEPPLTTAAPEPEPEALQEDDFEPDFTSVASPALEIPDLDDDLPAPEPETAEPRGGIGSFFSRRGDTQPPPAAPAPRAEPALRRAAPVAAAQAAPRTDPAQAAPRTDAVDESERMTIFGARAQAQAVGGKPRFLGLMLTLGLLVFLTAVALWAALFLDGGVSGFWRSPEDPATETARPEPAPTPAPEETAQTEPQPEQPTAPEQPAAPAPQVGQPPERQPAPVSDLAATRPRPEDAPAAALPTPLETPPDFTATDTAVLDALRDASPGSPAAPADPPPEQVETAQAETAQSQPTTTELVETAPQAPEAPGLIPLDDLFVAAIDRTDHSQDAVAMLPQDSFLTDLEPGAVASPAQEDTTFALDARGLVVPTPEGALNPDGILVHLGRPPIVPPPTPERRQAAPEEAPEAAAEQNRLANLRPRARPEDFAEQTERTQLGGLTREELATLRPRPRPAVLAALVQAQREAETTDEADIPEPEETQTAEPDIDSATALAIATVRKPRPRPRNFAAIVERVQPRSAAAPAVPQTQVVAPRIPSSTSVSRQATLNNAINLRRVNLIGVYGTPSNRRALVRLPSGRYKKVQVGDTVDGGRIIAIGDSELRYQKGGRNVTLKIPSG